MASILLLILMNLKSKKGIKGVLCCESRTSAPVCKTRLSGEGSVDCSADLVERALRWKWGFCFTV